MSMHRLIHRLIFKGLGQAALVVTEIIVQSIAYKTQEGVKEALKSESQKAEEKRLREKGEREIARVKTQNTIAANYELAYVTCWITCAVFVIACLISPSDFGGHWWWIPVLLIAGFIIRAIGPKR